ncbi:hypothetical protein SEUCBS139899_010900 [Sporothrix eucalyptigena]|uniref:Uncharacterized protein n=1 Tax=Sporothrix eucalyptigena TaxID=1812306 RepID=A0ABP0CZI7_9PEZI
MANLQPPAISRVCHEARAIALQTGESYRQYRAALAGRFPVAPGRYERYKMKKLVWARDVGWRNTPYETPTTYEVDLATRSLNKAHPWVEAQLAQMPQFVRHVMFRYCNAKCYLPKEERPARPIRC